MGTVVTYGHYGEPQSHERATLSALAQAIAALRGDEFAGEYVPSARYATPLYFVPGETVVGLERARAVGMRSADDLYGGVVPYAFLANKTIAHPLVAPEALAPQGWSSAFATRVREVVLPGYAAFTLEDAYRAARALLAEGPVRIKPGDGIGGRDQLVVRDLAALEGALDRVDPARLARNGLVIESELAGATTYSVGQVAVNGMAATYCGTQKLTPDNGGQPAYGGSDLLIARGGWAALDALELAPELRLAIRQARAFDTACRQLPGVFASRRNYDTLLGHDAEGQVRAGVLEQSWRIGGASGPEIAALAAFHAQPGLRAVHARSAEIYGECAVPPPHAIVHYRGVDARAGALTKYTVIERYEPAR